MTKSAGHAYKRVSLIDVNELLSFVKKEYHELDEQIKEEKRVEKELKEFIELVQKHSKHKIHYIGHEKRHGKHLIRFLFKDGGFLEVMVEKPLAINAHFLNEDHAEKFRKGLKKALHEHIPEHKVKDIFIDSIKVEDGFKDEMLTFDKWDKMHVISIHKTLAVTIAVVFVFLLYELAKLLSTEIAVGYFEMHESVITLGVALIIALVFVPIKNWIDKETAKIFRL